MTDWKRELWNTHRQLRTSIVSIRGDAALRRYLLEISQRIEALIVEDNKDRFAPPKQDECDES